MTEPENVEPTEDQPSFQTLEELQAHILFMKDQAAAINNAMSDDDKAMEDARKELEKIIAGIEANKRKRESERWQLHKRIRSEESDLEAWKRRLALEAEQRRIMELMAAQRIELDELTKNAPWRDYALPHQIDGAHKLAAARRAICADGMGTGKTLQSIMYLDFLRALMQGGRRVLIICPGEVASGFEREFNKWGPKRSIINMANKGTANTLAGLELFTTMLTEFVILINYEALARSFGDRRTRQQVLRRLKAARFDTIIGDEFHRAKETDKPTYRAIRDIVLSHNTCAICEAPVEPVHNDGTSVGKDRLHRMGRCEEHGVVEDCNRSVVNFLAMTGTPILNRPDEIFAPLSIVNDQLFPYLHAFERDYCERYNGNKLKWKYGGESRLVAKIKEFYIRRTRADAGIILPPQTITVHELQLDKDTYPKQQKFLEKLEKHGRIEIAEGRISTMMSMLALITRLRQGTVWPGGVYITHEDPTTGEKWREHAGADYQESIKVDKAMELAEEFTENGERTLILSQFSEPIDQMVDRLNAQGIRAVAFYGGTSKSDRVENNREAIKANFDRVRRAESGDEVKWDVIVAHYKLASEGLNLTDVTQTIFMDEQWNPGMEQQAMERTMRMGQTEETGVHILRIKNSIDMWMASLIEEKRKIVDGFETEISFQQLAAMINDKPLSGEGDEDAA